MTGSNAFALTIAVLLACWTVVGMRVPSMNMRAAVPHNVAWCLGLLIVGSGLLNYAPTSAYAWLLILCCIMSFNTAVLWASAVKSPAQTRSRHEPLTPVVAKKTYFAILAAFTLGFVIYLSTISSDFGLSVLINDPTSLRATTYTGTSYQKRFPLAGKLLFYLGPLAFVLTCFPSLVRGKGMVIWLRIGILSYLVIAQVATLQRTNFFVCVLWVAGILWLRPRTSVAGATRKKLGTWVRAFAVVLVTVTVFQGIAVALGKTGADDPRLNAIVSERVQNSPYTSLLVYVSSGIPAFGTLVEADNPKWPPVRGSGLVYGDYNPRTWGRATFAGPLKIVPAGRHWDSIAPFVKLPLATNVYTWAEPWYRDFRLPGVVFGSFFMGFMLSAVCRLARTPESIMFAGLLLGLSALATFTFKYTGVSIIVLYASLLFLRFWRTSRVRANASSEPLMAQVSSG